MPACFSPTVHTRRFRPCSFAACLAAALLLVLGLPGRAGAQTAYTSSGGISIDPSGTDETNNYGTSAIAVNDSGTVSGVSVKLNGLSVDESGSWASFSTSQTSFILVYCPAAGACREFMLLGSTGDGLGGPPYDSVPSTLTIEDSAGTLAPGCTVSLGSGCPAWTTSMTTVRPASYWKNDAGITPTDSDLELPSPYSGYSLVVPTLDGSSTLSGEFSGVVGTGTWTLLIDNDLSVGDNDPISITNWTLSLTYTVAPGTTTSISSSSNPSFTSSPNNSVPLTATVTSTAGTVNSGTVNFEANGSTISGCGAVTVSNGTATCNTSFTSQGVEPITAAYTGTGAFANSTSNPLDQFVTVHPTVTGNLFCNPGSDSVGESGSPGPLYPSLIYVSGETGTTVSTVSVQLNGVTGYIDAQHLLVSPDGGHNLDFYDGAWFNNNQTSGINLAFDDTAGQYPTWGAAPAAGSYEASDQNETPDDSFTGVSVPTGIPSVPGTVNYGYDPREPDYRGPTTNTFENEFSGATTNGYWALYAINSLGTAETIGGGWCIDLTPNTGTATTTSLTSSQQKATARQSVNLTATVSASGSTPSSGTVTFLDNGATPSGASSGNTVVSLNGSGQAVFPTSVTSYSVYNGVTNSDVAVYEGDHNFTADYSGSTTYDPSNSTTFWQRFDNASTASYAGSNTWSYCNAGPVIAPANETGAFFPNPSNVFVTNLPGTLKTAGVTLNDLANESGETSTYDTQMMVESPSGAAFDFFSNAGPSSGTSLTAGNYNFADGNPDAGTSQLSPGTYGPTSYGSSAHTFTASPFYPVPGTIDYATPHGSSTFLSTFGGTTGNGTWSLFMNASSLIGADLAVTNGWCVNLTENPVTVDATLGHTGSGSDSDFVPGETNAAINVGIENQGTGTAGDPAGNNANPLTVTDTLPSGLSYASFIGTNWSCANSLQTVTCTNDAASVAQGTSYPALTIDVNVSSGASGTVSNGITVSGAGASSTTAGDSITIAPPPSLSINLTQGSTFTQGQTAQWNVVVNNTAGSGSMTSGVLTVSDVLPSGYTLENFSGALWTCSGSSTASCTTTQGIAGGSSSTTLTLIVDVPSTSPVSVSDSASAWGGGDPTHSSAGTAVVSNTDTVTVTQVPASIAVNGSQTQSAQIGTAFGSLAVTVKDAAGVPIPNYSSATFTAATGTGGASGTFLNDGTNTISVATNSSGIADPGQFTANGNQGSFNVTVTPATGTGAATFSLTNAPPPVTQLAFGVAPLANIEQGGNAGAGVTVLEEGETGTVYGGGSDSITLTVTYPDTTTQTYTATAASGVATFNLSGVSLTQLGSYTYTASLSGVTSAIATENTIALAYTAPTTPIGTPSATQTATLAIGSNFTLGSIGMLTEGATDLDFQAATGGSCTTNAAYTAGQTCTVNYTFQPTYPGLRRGAIVLYDSASHIFGMVYLQGLGNGPQAIFSSNNATSPLGNGFSFNRPFGTAVDRIGDVFVSDYANSAVYEIQGPPINTVNSLGSGFNNPEGIALDGAGNLFVADTNNSQVKEIVAAGGYTTVRALGGSFTFTNPTGVVVDGAGNVFVADAGTNKQVEEISAASGYTTVQALATGFQQPSGITIDGSGNLFVVDYLTTAVTELQANSNYASQSLGSGLSGPTGIAIDAAGNLFVANQSSNAVDEIFAGGGYTNVQPVGSGFDYPSGVALDAGGNVYVADTVHSAVDEVDFTDAPTLNFASTAAGSTSGPQTVTIANDGNQALNFSAVTYPADFPEASGVGTDCSTATPVASGGSCTLSIDFTPLGSSATGASTPLTEGVSLADNGPNANLSVTLSGTETIGPPVGWVFPVVDSSTGGVNVAQADTLKASGAAGDLHDGTPVAQVQILIDGTPVGNATLGVASPGLKAVYNNAAFANGGWTFSYSASTLSLGTHTLSAVAYDTIGLSATIGTKSFTVATNSSGPPVGWVDGLFDSSTGGGTTVGQSDSFTFTGAVGDPHDGTPVHQVQVLIDGSPVGTATLGLASTGLVAAYNNPSYANGGWSFTGPASGLAIGPHTASAIATDSLGLSTNLGTLTFMVAATSSGPPVGWIDWIGDSTTGGTTVGQSDNLTFAGAAGDPHDGTPVHQVQILIDGSPVGTATLGLPSTGLEAHFNNNPNYANGGWSFMEPASGLSAGPHTASAIATDSLNLSTNLGTISFTVAASSAGPPVGWLDGLKDATTGSTTVSRSDNFVFTGAAGDPHDGTPVAQVQILIDGNPVGTATRGLPSTGLEAIFNNPNYAQGGWTYTGSASGLTPGQHTASAIATDSLSLSTTLGTLTFTVTN